VLHHGATGGASGPLEEGKTVIWQFGDFPGEAPVSVKKEIPSELIVFEWAAAESKDEDLLANKMHKAKDYNTRVEIKFESLDPESSEDLRIQMERGSKRSRKFLRELYGLVANDFLPQGLRGIRNQPAKGVLLNLPPRRQLNVRS
jgi:hypothetical protein